MLINKKEYIVKAKKANIKISNVQNKKDEISFLILWIITMILCAFAMKNSLIMIVILLITICLGVIVILSNKWKLQIEDEIFYIRKGFLNYIIEYKDLINVRKVEVTDSEKSYLTQHHLKIEYMKNNSYKELYLPYSKKKMEQIISEICKLFITNVQLEKYHNIYDDYLDIK